ncbi:MAG: hypothetical protein AAF708_12170 [Deinococcota bacterium]
MPSQYIVYARIPEGADSSSFIASFSDAFKVSDSKARALIGKLPGKVSKSVTSREARRLAKRFERIGLLTEIVDSASGEVVSASTLAASPAAETVTSAATPEPIPEATPEATNNSTSNGLSGPSSQATHMAASENFQDTFANTASSVPANAANNTDNVALVARDIPALQHSPLPGTQAVTDGASREAKKAAATQALAASISQTVVVEDPAQVGLDPERDPPPLPLHVRDGSSEAAHQDLTQARHRFSLGRKFGLVAVLSSLLVVLVSAVISSVLVPRLLQQEQRAKTEGIATTFATSIAALIARPLDDPASSNLLQRWLEQTQPFLATNDVAMVVVTDSSAQVLAGWRDSRLDAALTANLTETGELAEAGGGTSGVTEMSAQLQALIAAEVTRASGLFAQGQTNLRLGDRPLAPLSLAVQGFRLHSSAEVIVQAREQGPQLVGTVVVGSFAETAARATRTLLLWLLVAASLPLVVAIFIALSLARRVRRHVLALAEQAGTLELQEAAITLNSGDELDTLATSLEQTRQRLQPSSSTRTGESTQIS